MLSGIASYIFGNENNDEASVVAPVVLHATSTDDDWTLIDKDDGACRYDDVMSSSSEELSSARLTPQSNASPAPSSRVCSPASTDSNGWYVTPPPCFTAGSPPHGIETSPLENLLIEHPSMSVYHNPRSGSLSSHYSSSSSLLQDETVLANQDTQVSSRVSRPPQLPSSSSLPVPNLTELQTVRQSQRCRQKKQRSMLNKRHLERSNKTSVFVGKAVKRRDRRARLPSGANNNRKC